MESKFDRMEWKWNGIGMENFREKESVEYVVEMERKWNGIFLTKQVETNFDVMEWKWNGVEKENFE